MKKRKIAEEINKLIDKKLSDGRACHKILVPKSCCSLDFATKEGRKGKYDYSLTSFNHMRKVGKKMKSEAIGFETVRGEQMFIDIAKDGRVLSIELIDSPQARKRCMRG